MTARRALWLVAAGVALLLLAGTASIPLLDPDESRFARTSLEMLRAGDMVVPHFAGEPRLVKPPLIHWIQAFLFQYLGSWPWVARLHAVIASVLLVLLTGWIAGERYGTAGRAWAAAILGSSPLVLAVGRLGIIDGLLAVHVLAVVALDMTEPPGGRRYDGLLVGGLLGFAFMAKGPVGVILPLIVMLAGRSATGRGLRVGRVAILQAVAAWCVIVLPWAVAFSRRVGLGEVGGVLGQEVLAPYFAGGAHAEPAWFYGLVVLVGFYPWVGPLVVGIGRAFARRAEPDSATALYAAAGLVAGIVFFSMGRNKLPTYMLPLAPLAALIVTWELSLALAAPRERTSSTALVAGALGAMALVLGLATDRLIWQEARDLALWGALLHVAGALVAGGAAIRRRPRWVYGTAAVCSAAFMGLAFAQLLPAIGRRHSTVAIIEAVPELASERPVVAVAMRVPSLTYYLDRAPELVSAERLAERLAAADDPLLVFDVSDLPSVPEATLQTLEELGRQGKYRVYQKRRALDPPGGPG